MRTIPLVATQDAASASGGAPNLARLLGSPAGALQSPVHNLLVRIDSVLASAAELPSLSNDSQQTKVLSRGAALGRGIAHADGEATTEPVGYPAPVVLVRDNSLPDSHKAVGMLLHSGLRSLFLGPEPIMRAGAAAYQSSTAPRSDDPHRSCLSACCGAGKKPEQI